MVENTCGVLATGTLIELLQVQVGISHDTHFYFVLFHNCTDKIVITITTKMIAAIQQSISKPVISLSSLIIPHVKIVFSFCYLFIVEDG